jgi:hypothetical protein
VPNYQVKTKDPDTDEWTAIGQPGPKGDRGDRGPTGLTGPVWLPVEVTEAEYAALVSGDDVEADVTYLIVPG